MIQPLNRRRFSAGLALAPWAAGGLLTGCGNIPDSIKIGVAQPLSGPLSALGKDLLNGVQLAINELNKGNFSIDGKRVTLELPAIGHQISHAGHNAHRENPVAVAERLAQIFRLSIKDTL